MRGTFFKKLIFLSSIIVIGILLIVRCKSNNDLPAGDKDNGGLYLPGDFEAVVVIDSLKGRARHLTVNTNGDIYVSDPQYYRVFVYSNTGQLRASFGSFGTEPNRFGLPVGLAADLPGNAILVADAANNRVMSFPLAP